jgi:hypothetical protein
LRRQCRQSSTHPSPHHRRVVTVHQRMHKPISHEDTIP